MSAPLKILQNTIFMVFLFTMTLHPNEETPLARLDRTLHLKEQALHMGGLAMIYLAPNDEVTVSIGNQDDGGDRISSIQGRLITNIGGGVLHVTESSSFTGDISLGSYAGRCGNTPLSKPGILRGFIQRDAFGVVDTVGKTFFNKDSNNLFLPETYHGLSVNDIDFFKA